MKNEMFLMYKYPQMIKAASFCAAVFGLLAVLLKNSIVIIPEVTEMRICNMLSVCMGIWFGPAGAWGCAVGNLIGDFNGSLTILTVFGFVGNFLSAYAPYKLWNVMGAVYEENKAQRPTTKSKKWIRRFACGGLLSVCSCCSFLALVFDIFNTLPAVNTYLMLFLNNLSATIMGVVLFLILSVIPEQILPYWRVMMEDEKEYSFLKKDKWKVYAIMVITLVFTMIVAAYILINGYSLSSFDTFHQPMMYAIFAIYVVVIVILLYSCKWEKIQEEEEEIWL